MAKLDRLGWAAGAALTCHGARLGIRVTDADALERIRRHLPPGWKPSASPVVDTLYSLFLARASDEARVRRFHLLYVDAGRLARSLDLKELLEAFESDLHFRVALSARRRLFVHAGVVGLNGRAILIPGRSMSGKTTLVAALVRAGATYYSDEFAPIDAAGRVHPYPKRLGLRSPDGQSRELLAAETLGARIGRRPLPVELVVLTDYRRGARWRPRPQTPAQAVLALLGHTVLARVRPRFALETLHKVARSATVLKGGRGDAAEVAEVVLDRLASAGPAGRRDQRRPLHGPVISGDALERRPSEFSAA